MPDATEWLVEYFDSDTGTNYEHIEERDDAIAYLRQLIGQGRTATLYQIVPFEVQIGVTVKAPRKRRKNPSPALEPDPAPPLTGPGNGEAGEPKAAVPAPVYDCEARLDSAPACLGPVTLDSLSCGWFCGLHLTAIPPSGRGELHRKHGSRNRSVRVAHAG